MSGAVASGVTKKRKKSDTKPQAQKNKCYNEKRRREQENLYIEDLADLISASFADMSSLSAVKPDKCAILQETVNQIRRIKEQELSRAHLEQSTSSSPLTGVGGGGAAGGAFANAVQQGEVSSSRPTDILANSDFAPFLLEALEGFLIIVSKEGRIEQCSKNIEKYIKFTQEEVLHKDFFNIIHLGDTTRFSAILKPPMSVGWNSEDSELSAPNRSFTCRFLVKPPDDREASLDERQQRIDKYEQMHVCSTEVQYPPKDENAETCLMCIARRIPHTEKAKVVSGGGSATLEQFSTKLDTSGKIVSIDTTTVSATYAPYINKGLVGSIIQELCPSSEVPRINAHLNEVIQTGNSVTATFRLRFANALDKYINIQSKSKFFKSDVAEHIMSTHFIIGIGELDELESGASDTVSVAGGGGAGATTPIGDPVMASVMNGATPAAAAVSTPSTSNVSLNNNNSISSAPVSSYNLFPNAEHEFDFSFPTSTWDMELGGWGETQTTSSSRPSSRHSAAATTPTPRPPSASPHGQSGVPAGCVPSPLHQPFSLQPQPSPAASHHGGSNAAGYSTASSANYSALEDVNQTFKMEEQAQNNNITVKMEPAAATHHVDESLNDSGKLRNLLELPKKSVDNSTTSPKVNSEEGGRNSHCILKGLLNQDDDDETKHDIKMHSSDIADILGMTSSKQNQDQPKVSSGNNHMLRKLLNDKSDDDDDSEARAGFKKQSALLHQLLKNPDEDRKPVHTDNTSQDDSLLRSLGFTNSPTSPSRKRPSEDGDDHQNKRLSDGTQVTSSGSNSGSSKLWEKNKMLASLLAIPSATTPIPTLPARVITATPQEISRVGEIKKVNYLFNNDAYNKTNTSSANSANSTTARGRGGAGGASRGPGSNTLYLNQLNMNQNFANSNDILNQRVPNTSIRNTITDQNNQYSVAGGGSNARVVAGQGALSGGNDGTWENDHMLSDILDQVIDSVPAEAFVTSNTALKSLIDELIALQNNNREMTNDAIAINAMAQSLRQCENAVKNPSLSVMSSIPPGTPPAYSAPSASTVMTSTNQSSFPPPPGYPQQRPQRFPVRNPQYAMAGSNLTQQQLILQRTKMQQEQKRRLLQQQQQQQLLIPSNATAELNSGIANIDNLLNNTVAPNVSLQRSSNVPDSQLSPGYNMSPGQRLQQPYSPSYSQGSQFQAVGGSRLSPLPTRPGVPFQNTQTSQPQQAQQQVGWGSPSAAQQTRMGLSQQQNPMLNAQLTGANYQNRPFANVQRGNAAQINAGQRSGSVNMVGSPGSAASANARQSPFQTTDAYQSTGSNSPTATTPTYNSYQQQQLQHRLQRTVSAPPSATTHLPGGLGSPRHYPHPQNSHLINSTCHPHIGPPYPHTGQQGFDSVQYCYDQSSLQLAYNGADRGRAPPPQGGGANSMTSTSEFVRQELRAVVGARTGQQGQGQPTGGGGGGTQQQPQQQQPQNRVQQQQSANTMHQLGGQQVSTADLEALSITFEMPPGGSESPKIWGTIGSNDIGSMSPQASATMSSSSRTIMEETTRPGDQNSSLLQKLLSE